MFRKMLSSSQMITENVNDIVSIQLDGGDVIAREIITLT